MLDFQCKTIEIIVQMVAYPSVLGSPPSKRTVNSLFHFRIDQIGKLNQLTLLLKGYVFGIRICDFVRVAGQLVQWLEHSPRQREVADSNPALSFLSILLTSPTSFILPIQSQ